MTIAILRRGVAALSLLAATSAALSACSGSDSAEDDTASASGDATAQACRLASVTNASLAGPREHLRGGAFYPEDAQTYTAAITALSAAVSAEGDIDAPVTAAITDMVGGFSRSKSYIEESTTSSSYQASKVKALAGFEERAQAALVAVCPNLEAAE